MLLSSWHKMPKTKTCRSSIIALLILVAASSKQAIRAETKKNSMATKFWIPNPLSFWSRFRQILDPSGWKWAAYHPRSWGSREWNLHSQRIGGKLGMVKKKSLGGLSGSYPMMSLVAHHVEPDTRPLVHAVVPLRCFWDTHGFARRDRKSVV